MEWILAALVACAVVVQVTEGGVTCESENYAKLKGFNRQVEEMLFPCKYWALKGQKCGNYLINLAPGNKWVYKDYRLDTLWLGVVDDTDPSRTWQGRVTNKMAVKYLNAHGEGRPLFNKKGGGLDTDALLTSGIDNEGRTYAEESSGAFRVTFTPWHPRSKEYLTDVKNSYKMSTFKFECFHDDGIELQPYPRQMCGNNTRNVVEIKGKELFAAEGTSKDLRHRMVLYHDLFLNEDVSQMDERCQLAASTLSDCESEDRIIEVLSQCEAIISGNKLTECVSRFTCHPMDTFNSCLRWGCSGEKAFDKANKDDCYATAAGIDQCGSVSSVLGDLTSVVDNANCYKDYLSLATK